MFILPKGLRYLAVESLSSIVYLIIRATPAHAFIEKQISVWEPRAKGPRRKKP